MTIAFIAAGATVDVSSGSPSIPYPAGIALNDVLVILERVRSTIATANNPASPLTWTQRAAQGTCHKVWTAVYDGLATAPTIASGGNFMGAVMLALRGVDTANPVGANAGSLLSQANLHYPALTVPADGSLILTYSSVAAAATAVTATGGYTQAWLYNAAGTTMGAFAQYLIQTSLSNITAADLATSPGTVASQFGVTLSFNAPGTGTADATGGGGFNDLSGGFGA